MLVNVDFCQINFKKKQNETFGKHLCKFNALNYFIMLKRR